MSCLFKFKWVKLLREHLPDGKGIMSDWAKLASRVAFRKGNGFYCGYNIRRLYLTIQNASAFSCHYVSNLLIEANHKNVLASKHFYLCYNNPVNAGSWVGGILGVRSILGVKSSVATLNKLNRLQDLGYLHYNIEKDTKKLTLSITDWVMECCGEECQNDNVYATNDYGFLCVPRDITERLVENGYKFEEADAWLDLWVHTIYKDRRSVFSFEAPIVRYNQFKPFLTLETLSKRWGWEKTKTWRFFQKYQGVFALKRLLGNYGCVIFNQLYPTNESFEIPSDSRITEIFYSVIRENINISYEDKTNNSQVNRVALFAPIIRAYISSWSCKTCKDCKGKYVCVNYYKLVSIHRIRGPC